MAATDYAKQRVAAVLKEIDRLKQSEFPYKHPCDALELLAEKFKHHQTILEKVSRDTPANLTKNACSASLSELRDYVPILGFILRSTNVRNAFEAYAPLQRLARSFLKEGTKLIVSSEWEYSPTVYKPRVGLDGFVLIGLPAPESANPLLIPLAGHELGHTVWTTSKFSDQFIERIEDNVLNELKAKHWDEYAALYPQYKKDDLTNDNLIARPTWGLASYLALSHTEEIFCDLFGLRLFAESYLHAFAYLLFPGFFGKRLLHYPKLERRVSHLINAAKQMDVKVPAGFEPEYVVEEDDPDKRDERAMKLHVSVADVVSASLTRDIEKRVQDYAKRHSVPMRDVEEVTRICNEFREKIAPMSKQETLINLLNAGWDCILDPNLWENVPLWKKVVPGEIKADKERVLKDLMLKSMEVSEIYERLRKSL